MEEKNEQKKVLGLVMELNPPHYGHKYFIDKAIELIKPDVVIAIISTNFSMRGDISVIDKFSKSEICLKMGIDLVLELPLLSSLCSSEYFCSNAIKALVDFEITDLAFGVEDCSLVEFNTLLSLTNSKAFINALKENLDQGYSYSTANNKALETVTNNNELILKYSSPNNSLGLQYLKTLNEINSNVRVTLINRVFNNYYDTEVKYKISSATSIRNALEKGLDISKFVLDETGLIDLKQAKINLFNLLKYKILLNFENLKEIKLVNEGIENRLYETIQKANDLDIFITLSVTKRYKENLIKRIIINILLDINKNFQHNNYYLRVLAFNQIGNNHLNTLATSTKKRIITSIKKHTSNDLVRTELSATILYSIITNNQELIKKEYQIRRIK